MQLHSDRPCRWKLLSLPIIAGLLFCSVTAGAQTITVPDAPIEVVLRGGPPVFSNIVFRRDGDLTKALTVYLESSDTGIFKVPPNIVFDEHRATASAFIQANAPGSALLMIHADDHAADPVAVNVRLPIDLSVTPRPINIFTNYSLIATATVVRAGLAPGDLGTATTVYVAAGNPGVFSVSPASIVFPPTNAMTQTRDVVVTATALGSAPLVVSAEGLQTVSNTVNVYAESVFSLAILPETLTIILDQTGVATARLVRAASWPDDLNQPMTVTLSSDQPAAFSVPGQVVFAPTNTLSQTNEFVVTAIAPGIGRVTAAAPGSSPAAAQIRVAQSIVRELRLVPDLISVNLEQNPVASVILERRGGMDGDLAQVALVAVSSSNPDVFDVQPATVVFPATSAAYQTATLLVQGKQVGDAELRVMTPFDPVHVPAAAAVTVFLPTLALPPYIYLAVNETIEIVVSRSGGDPQAPLTVMLARPPGVQYFEIRGDSADFGFSDTVTIPAGVNSAVFQLRGLFDSIDAITLTASAPGYKAAEALVWVGTVDSNGDGIPDWWYRQFFPALDPAGPSIADQDQDGDGISNYWEFRLGSDPFDAYSLDPDRILTDGAWDSDGDGLTNWEEIHIYSTHPIGVDTDDDGILDGAEVDAGTSPNNALSPYVQRALEVFGNIQAPVQIADETLNDRDRDKFNMTAWTLEAHVMPNAWPAGRGRIVQRMTSGGRVNYEMGLRSDGRFYALFQSQGANPLVVETNAPVALPLNAWSHVAARLAGGKLTLFIDGVRVAERVTGLVPAVETSGRGRLEMGAGLTGYLDEIRVWNHGVADDDVFGQYNRTLLFKVSGYGALGVSGNGRMQYAGASAIDRLERWTLATWVRIDPGSGAGILMAREANVTRDQNDTWGPDLAGAIPDVLYNYNLGINAEGVLYGFHDYNYSVPLLTAAALRLERRFNRNEIVGITNLRDGQWHHVAYVNDGRSLALFVDGNRETVGSLPSIPASAITSNVFLINDGNSVFGDGLSGLMDETRIYNYGMVGARLGVMMNTAAQLDDPGLLSAFTYDFNAGKARVRDWSLLRDPGEEYGLLGGDARIELDENVPFVPIDTLGRYVDQMPGYWPFDDGGRFAENMMMRHYISSRAAADYLALGGLIAMAAPATPSLVWNAPSRFVGRWGFDTDSDDDGLPDWWEVCYGLDPDSPTGVNGPWGDPDGDGLHNLAEFLAGTDPRLLDTAGDGLSDFYSYSPHGPNRYRIFGELFTDYDGMDDEWEVIYGLDPNRFDAHEDADGDGWSNLSEFLAGIDPQTGRSSGMYAPDHPSSYPRPRVTFSLEYTGLLGEGSLVIQAYRTASMDGEPDAVFVSSAATNSYPATIEVRDADQGYLREGPAWFFVFIDNDGNRTWDPGEPAGLVGGQPVNVSWGALGALTVGLTDTANGFNRFAWEPVSGVQTYDVVLRSMSATGAPVVMERTLRAPRHYVHAQDYLLAGLVRGLPKAGYQWFVYRTDLPVPQELARGSFVVDYPSLLAAPVTVTPNHHILRYARNEFVWSMDPASTGFELQIATNALFNDPVVVEDGPAPLRNADGRVRYTPLALAGDEALPNGTYYWRVRSRNARTISAWSDPPCLFEIDLSPRIDGPFSIAGELLYPGKVSNSVFVVQAFKSPGFGGRPEAQVIVTNYASTNSWPRCRMAYTLRGLRAGTYYVRAFLDQNDNRKPDVWETQGVVTQLDSFYFPKAMRVPASRSGELLATMFRDIDNDRIADDWEYSYYGNLTTAGPETLSASGVTHYDAYAAGRMNLNPTDPDAAGPDGIPVRFKLDLGLDFAAPLHVGFAAVRHIDAGRPVMWLQPISGAGGRFSMASDGRVMFGGGSLVYAVQFSYDLANWTDVSGAVTIDPDGGGARFVPEASAAVAGFYRLVIRW